MQVGLIEAVQRQRGRQIDIRGIRHALLYGGLQGGKVHRRIAVFLRQILPLVRDDGRIDLHVRPGKIAVIDAPEAVQCVPDRIVIQRVIELGRIAVREIDPVAVLLPEKAGRGQGPQLPEALAQRELIERVGFKLCHEAPAPHRHGRQLRLLRQLPPLAL